jgi:hypothetical protein
VRATEGRDNKGSLTGYKLMIWGEGSRYGRRKAMQTPTRQDIDPGESYGITIVAPRLYWEEKTLDFHCMY